MVKDLDRGKLRFGICIKASDFKMWDFLINGPFFTIFHYNNKVVNKLDFYWIKEDNRKVKIGIKEKHLLISDLSSKKLF